jgi:hypothetical protein
MNPAYSTAIGLLYWGAKGLESERSAPYPTAPAGGSAGASPGRYPQPLPVDRLPPAMKTAEKTTPLRQTGRRRGLFDLTGACEQFVAGEGDGLLSVFVPHATAGLVVMELGAGSDADLVATLDRLLPRDERWVHRHGPRATEPIIVVPMVASAVADGTGRRRPSDARDVAVDRPSGPQSGQLNVGPSGWPFLGG